jgi:cation:H+ antiporter
LLWQLGFIAAGLVLLVLGARWLVDAASELARRLGISELVIGLTIVAGGTSLPELATSVVAAIRGERDIAVGNVVGSNLFNILAVLGLAAAIAPDGVAVADQALRFDIPVMIAVAAACLPIFFTEHRIARWEGALFLAYYVAYTATLVMLATQSEVLPLFRLLMIGFVLPLTAITLIVISVRTLCER